MEYIRDIRAARLAAIRDALNGCPLAHPPHLFIDLWRDLSIQHSDSLRYIHQESHNEEDNGVKVRTEHILREITRRYPFMSVCGDRSATGRICFSSLWEVKAYGRKPYPGYIEPPDAGYNAIWLKIYFDIPERDLTFRKLNDDLDITQLDPTNTICAIYYYDNDYDGGYTYIRDKELCAIHSWSKNLSPDRAAKAFVDEIRPLIERYRHFVIPNPHINLHFYNFTMKYWDFMCDNFKIMEPVRLSVRRWLGGQSLARLADSTICAVLGVSEPQQRTSKDHLWIQVWDSIRFDPELAPEQAEKASKKRSRGASPTRHVALLRCIRRALKFLLIPKFAHLFDPLLYGYDETGAPLTCSADSFLRGTTTETNWRNHPPRETGVIEARKRMEKRLKMKFEDLTVRESHEEIWPLWALDAMVQMAPTVAKICCLCVLCPESSERILQCMEEEEQCFRMYSDPDRLRRLHYLLISAQQK